MWSIFFIIGILSSEGSNWISFTGELENNPKIELIEHSQLKTIIETTIPGVREEKKVINGKGFSLLSFPYETDFLHIVGKPQLPIISKYVVIPDDKNVKLKILSYQCDTIIGCIPMPYQDHFRYKGFMIDEEFYSQDLTYPDEFVKISEPDIMRDYRFVTLTFQPVRYNSAKNEVYVYHHIKVELEYFGKSYKNVLKREHLYTSYAFESIYKHLFINYDFIKSDSVARGTYLIITADALNASIQPLADWRNREGRRVKVVNISDVCNPPSDSLIKEYLIDAYFNWEYPLEYLLLVGDVGDIPTHIIPEMSDCATDFIYYGDLNGTLSGREILVGRLPTSNTGTLTSMINRIMDYQREPYLTDPTWYRKACAIDGADWHGLSSARNIKNNLLDYGFTLVDTLYSINGGATTANIKNAVNSGRLFTIYLGHGWPDGWWLTDWGNTFDNNDVYSLTNGEKVPIVIAASCGTGMFQNATCHGEAWIREKGIAYIGAGATPASGLCERVPSKFIRTYVDSIYNLGQCSSIAIHNFGFNLLGDPGSTIWGDIPTSIICTYEDTMKVGENIFNVLVKEGGSPAKGVTVCLMSTNDVYAVGETDASGNITLNVVPKSDDTVYITATSPFHIPYEGMITVDHSTPFPGYLSHIVDDVTGGNGNGVLSPGETIYMSITLKNYGDASSNNINAILRTPDTMLVVTDSSKSYGNLAPGAQATQIFTFTVSDSYQYQDEKMWISFNMKVTDDSKHTWEFPISKEEIKVPDIVYVNHTVLGSSQPSDTATITVTLKNSGNDSVSSTIAYLTTQDPYVQILIDSSSFGSMGVGASADNTSNSFKFTTHPTIPTGYTVTFVLHPETSGWINWAGTRDETFDVVIGDSPLPETLFFDDFEHAGQFDPAKWDTSATHWFITSDTAYSGVWSVSSDTSYSEYPLVILPYFDLSSYKEITWSQYSYGMSDRCFAQLDTIGDGSWPVCWEGNMVGWSPNWWYQEYTIQCNTNWDSVGFRYLYCKEMGGGLYIDDVCITTPRDNIPPSFTNTTVWKDTLYTGPFSITAIITDNMYEVSQCSLYYKVNSDGWVQVLSDTTGNADEYIGSIPLQSIGDMVCYYLVAKDSYATPNRGLAPVGAPTDAFYSFVIRAIGVAEKKTPKVYKLSQNYPNPFTQKTVISYQLPVISKNLKQITDYRLPITLRIYDLSGRLVKTLVNKEQIAGYYKIKWDGKNNAGKKVATGIYFYRMEVPINRDFAGLTGGFKVTRKLTIIR